MIIQYPIKNNNLNRIYYGLGFVRVWNTRQTVAVIALLGKAVALDVQVGGAVPLDSQVGGAVAVDKTDE